MSSHVLVPHDGSDAAERALELARERHPDVRVTVLRVVEPLSAAGLGRADAPLETPVADGAEDDGQTGSEAHGLRADGARAGEGEGHLRTVEAVGTPAATIVEYAEDHDVDALFVGTEGRSGLARLLVGSVAEAVARHASQPVTLVE